MDSMLSLTRMPYLSEKDFANLNLPDQRAMKALLKMIWEEKELRNLFLSTMKVLVITTSYLLWNVPENFVTQCREKLVLKNVDNYK